MGQGATHFLKMLRTPNESARDSTQKQIHEELQTPESIWICCIFFFFFCLDRLSAFATRKKKRQDGFGRRILFGKKQTDRQIDLPARFRSSDPAKTFAVAVDDVAGDVGSWVAVAAELELTYQGHKKKLLQMLVLLLLLFDELLQILLQRLPSCWTAAAAAAADDDDDDTAAPTEYIAFEEVECSSCSSLADAAAAADP